MPSNVVRAARHRRALCLGISLSAAAHAAALAWIAVPAATAPAPPAEDASVPSRLPALEIVRLIEPSASTSEQRTPAERTHPAPSATMAAAPSEVMTAPAPAAPSAGGAISPSEAEAASPAALDVLLAGLTSAASATDRTDTSRPISAFKRLRPVSGTGVGSAVARSGGSDEDERSLWSKLFDGVTISVGAGPYCPVRGGPLILR